MKGWDRITIVVDDDAGYPGAQISEGSHRTSGALAPVIISASRATDIPAFYADWFMARFRKGNVAWINPYNRSVQQVSFARTRVIVFWSKNPRELMKYLDELDSRGMNYYFQFTLNDYGPERLEPGLPPLDERIETFNDLAGMIGPDRVIWRFDPLVLSDALSVETLVSRIKAIGDRIQESTKRLVFSFVDISAYKRVGEKLADLGFSDLRGFTHDEKILFAKKLQDLNSRWNFELFTCGEEIDLTPYGIQQGSCIDYDLMARVFSGDQDLQNFLNQAGHAGLTGSGKGSRALFPKGTGQRKECGCHDSKDIGQYNTCVHRCAYCYANRSDVTAKRNYEHYLRDAVLGQFHETIIHE